MRRKLPVFALIIAATCAGACERDDSNRIEAMRLTGGDPARGVEAIGRYGCGACHVIPGVKGADATVGPPLTSIARRAYLGGQLGNTPANMMRWIQKPQEIEKGTAMPDMGVTDQDARDIAAHLYTLR